MKFEVPDLFIRRNHGSFEDTFKLTRMEDAEKRNIDILSIAYKSFSVYSKSASVYGAIYWSEKRGVFRRWTPPDEIPDGIDWKGYNENYGTKHPCIVKPELEGQIIVRFNINSPESICAVTGCEFDELPDVLQHFYDLDIYIGNSILDRIDPLEYTVQNPWTNDRENDFRLDITLRFSKRGFGAIRSRLNLPRFTDWESLKGR